MGPFGLFRLATASPVTHVASPDRNVDAILQLLQHAKDIDCIVFPELCLSGYTCGDLFANQSLLQSSIDALSRLCHETQTHPSLIVVGLPLAIGPALYNVAAVLQNGKILGLVPKTYLPNYREFYEKRWFQSGMGCAGGTAVVAEQEVPFGTDLLFQSGSAVVGIEVCEDLWTPIPPSCHQAIAGANILLNLSASNETVGKSQWRRDLVVTQSGRCIAAYGYASAGPGESTTDLVFGGHCLIAENASILDEAQLVGGALAPTEHQPIEGQASLLVVADIDLERLAHDRMTQNSFADNRQVNPTVFRRISFSTTALSGKVVDQAGWLRRRIDPHPFVPADLAGLKQRCGEIFGIQIAGLAKRIGRLPAATPLVIGVSGGLDSTLALLVAVKMCDHLKRSRNQIHGITMPGFGTSGQTLSNAIALMDELGVQPDTVDIRKICLDTFLSIGHQPLKIPIDAATSVETLQTQLESGAHADGDLVFENVQARVRTLVLMSRGFVLGTGDLSEQALGWSTYNGDHMSMYNVNTSVPKTLVRFLVRFAADHYFSGRLRQVLHEIADTPISPELLPLSSTGEIAQHTETSIGPYELHDFFLYHFVRFGFGREKILLLAQHAKFSENYSSQRLGEVLDTFLRRFISQQFKRSCVPDGPKVGSVSLSPRGDWRMPSDAEVDVFLPPVK